MKIVSFYHDIDDSEYFENHALRLMNECANFDLDTVILERDFGDTWIENVKAKPTFLLEMFDSLQEPFLWVDIDCKILSNPLENWTYYKA